MKTSPLAALLLLASVSVAGAQDAPPKAPPGAMAPRPFEIVRLDPALDAILAPGTKLDTVATIPGLNSEGPLWRQGRLWVSDQRGGNLYAIAMDGTFTVLAEQAGGPIDPAIRVNQGPNGQIVDRDGSTIIMRQGLRDVGRRAKDGTFSVFLRDYQGKRFNSPNDLVFSPDGCLWFTDPTFSVPQGVARDLPYAAVFRYRAGVLKPVVTDMNLPNGIALSPDGRTLYVNNSRPDMFVRAYDVSKGGELSNQRTLVSFPADPNVRGVPDGMKVDIKGNIWTTGPGGISIISPKGKILGRIQLPTNSTNLAFGEDGHSVFFTSGATIYRLRSVVKGETPLYSDR